MTEDFAQRMSDIKAHAKGSSSSVEGYVQGNSDFGLIFEENRYGSLDEKAMESELATIARLLWARWQRQYDELVQDTDLNIDAEDLRDQNFFAERAEVEALGVSDDERIRFHTQGMQTFDVQIQPGTIGAIEEARFTEGVSEAAQRMVQDFRGKVRTLQQRFYG